MVKNVTGGNKVKKQKRGYRRREALDHTEPGQMFGQVLENRGDHFQILCADNVQRFGHLSNAAKKGQRLTVNSFVVLSVRDYETEKKNCDIIAAGNPPNDIKNIFRKINPLAGNDDNIGFYTQNDKFKEFEESEATANQVVVINKVGEANTETNEENNGEWYDENAKWEDPKAKEEIDWSDI
jgi:translation initiation factor IF-1